MIFEPLELLAKLAPLVPLPRFHRLRYHGVLAPAAGWRRQVVPDPPARVPTGACRACPAPRAARAPSAGPAPSAASPKSQDRVASDGAPAPASPRQPAKTSERYSWAELMRRVFEIDVLACPRCATRMRIIAQIHPPTAARAILNCLGLPTRAPPVAPARDDAAHRLPGLAV